MNAHGYERLTQDVDLVIRLSPYNIMRGLRALLRLDNACRSQSLHSSSPMHLIERLELEGIQKLKESDPDD